MEPLVAGVAVPVAIEQVGEDLRLDFARGQGCVAVDVALVAYPIVCWSDCRTIRVDGGGKNHGVAVGRPEGVIGFGGDVGQLFRIDSCPG